MTVTNLKVGLAWCGAHGRGDGGPAAGGGPRRERAGPGPAARPRRWPGAGAKVVNDPVEVADRDVVFTMGSTARDLEEVIAKLLADPHRAPGIVVDCSTVSTECSAAVREQLAQRGSAFLGQPGQRQRQRGACRDAQPDLLRAARCV